MRDYIIHPQTKEISRSEDYMSVKGWEATKFMYAKGNEEVENGEHFELTLTLESGETKTSRMHQNAYFNGANFYLN